MSTLNPRAPYSDSELARLYPPQLQLQQVQILMRHGERTPINARFRNTGLPAFWPYCSAVRRLTAAVLDADAARFSPLEWRRRLEAFGPADAPVPAAGPRGELDDICDMGMLTDRGRETTWALGQRLRRLYVDQLRFLPARLADPAGLYLRATPVPRALESMQQAFHGLYPPAHRAPDLAPLTIVSRSPADETLFPNDGNCRRFAAIARAFAQRAADRWNDSDDMAYLTRRLARWMPDDQPRVAVDSHPRLSGIMDTINATSAHGPATRLPAAFYDPDVKRIVEKIGVDEWYAGYRESREYRMLGIGGLLADVVARMLASVEQTVPEPVRFGLSGCHDTTLAATLASLGAFDEHAWPPFTSHIAIELFRRLDESPPPPPATTSWRPSLFGSSPPSAARSGPPGGYYVRLRYNDSPVSIPGCKPAGNHLDGDESFCTLEAFKAIVDKFTPRDWKSQCRANVNAPAFPEKPEPAGY